jgi:hypothetical protein
MYSCKMAVAFEMEGMAWADIVDASDLHKPAAPSRSAEAAPIDFSNIAEASRDPFNLAFKASVPFYVE